MLMNFCTCVLTDSFAVPSSEPSSQSESISQSSQSSQSLEKRSNKNKKRREQQQEFTHPWLIAILKGHTGFVTDMAFSNNGKYLASCAEGKWTKKLFVSIILTDAIT